ncbi:hypothetical protein ABPG72_014744 [Tetrahymena utriculariae]
MKQKKQKNLEQKRNPLLNEAIRQKSYQYISKFQQQGNALVERISKQDQLDLMMIILDKECEERTNLEVHILTHIVSDIRFFRDIKSSATDADETCFKLCKYMQGFFLSKDQVLFNQGDRGDTFWIIIKGEVRIYKTAYQKVEEQQGEDQENSSKQAQGKQQENANEEMQLQEIELVRLGQGNCFGEFALDPNKSNRRQASVQTTVDTFFGFIKGDKIIDILEKIKNSASFIESFSKMSILQGYPYEVIKQFYDISDEQKVEKNSIIYDVGDIPDNFYFIKEGEFSIYIEKNFNNQFKEVKKQTQNNSVADDSNSKKKKIFNNLERGKFFQFKILGEGESFGEEEIFKKKGVEYYRVYRVVCNSEKGIIYTIPKKLITRLLPQHPNIQRAMITQIQNKEKAREFRLNQVSSYLQQNDDSNQLDSAKSFSQNSLQEKTNQKPVLLLKFNRQIKQQNLSKTVTVAQNCDLAEDIFKHDEHNYLIYSSKIPSNQHLLKNPKVRKDDTQIQDKNGVQQVKEIDKNRYLKMMEIQNEKTNSKETRSTLLYEENLKKKKSPRSKKMSVFEDEILKEFSKRHNINPQELNSRFLKIKRQLSQASNNSEQSDETITQRRNTFDFLNKANYQKSILNETSKSRFYDKIIEDQRISPRAISVTSRYFKDQIIENQSPSFKPLSQSSREIEDIKNQENNQNMSHERYQPSFALIQKSQNSPLLNTETASSDKRGYKIPKLNLNEMDQTEKVYLKSALQHIKNNRNIKNNLVCPSPIQKSYMNNTPKTQKSPTKLFKFLKPEYNSPLTSRHLNLLEEIKTLPSINWNKSNFLQKLDQNRQNALNGINSEENFQKSIQKFNIMQNSSRGADFSPVYFSQESGFNKKMENTQDLQFITLQYQNTDNVFKKSKQISITAKPSQQQEDKLGFNINSIHSKKTFSLDQGSSNLILKNMAEHIYKSNLPQNMKIKKFQLSNTFKIIDKQYPTQAPQESNQKNTQPLKQIFVSRQPSPLK